MTVVYDTLYTPDDEPLVGAKVMIQLAAGRTGRAYYPPDEIGITGRVLTVTDDTGRWEADLLDNGDITPANTFYFVQIAANDNIQRAYGFQLDGEVGPVNVQDILVVLPYGGPEDPLPGGGAVDSVNSQTGVVVLDATDVGADPAGTAATAVAAEAVTRAADDATLQGNIDAEATTRGNADDALDARVDDLEAADAALPNPQPSDTVTPRLDGDDLYWDVNEHLEVESITLSGGTVITDARLATTAALPSCTYSNGSFGLGATLTATANGALADIDMITPALNNRLVIQNQAAPLQNGLYEVTQLGDGSNPFILTRCPELDEASEINPGAIIIVRQGAAFGGSGRQIRSGSYTVGTTDITFGDWPPRTGTLPGEVELGSSRGQRRGATDFREAATDVTTVGSQLPFTQGFWFWANLGSTGAQVTRIANDGTADGVAILTPGTVSGPSEGQSLAFMFASNGGMAFDPDKPAGFYVRGGKLSVASGGGDTFITRYGVFNNLLSTGTTDGFYFEAAADGGNWDAVSLKSEASQASQAWTRSSATITFTVTGHGLAVGDVVTVSVTSSAGALPVAWYTVRTVPTVDTFTVTGLNGGAASGTATIARSIREVTDVGTAPGSSFRQMTAVYDPATGAVKFYFAATLVATHTARVPTILVPNVLLGCAMKKETGTTAVTCATDRIEYRFADSRGMVSFAI